MNHQKHQGTTGAVDSLHRSRTLGPRILGRVSQECQQKQDCHSSLVHTEASNLRRPCLKSPASNRVLPVTTVTAATEGSETSSVSETVGDQLLGLSAETKAWLIMLGMSEDSLRAWALWHDSVPVAIAYFFVPQLLSLVGGCYIVTGAPLKRYQYSVTYIFSIAWHILHAVLIWRFGPTVTETKLFMGSLPLYWSGITIAAISTFLGPVHSYPFGSSVHYSIVLTFFVFNLNITHKSGLIYTERPRTPRTSMAKTILQAVVMTARIMDNLTDFGFFRTVLDERRAGCWWFGSAGQCHVYSAMLAVLGICASADYLASTVLVVLGPVTANRSQRIRRAILVTHICGLLFELAIATVTLLDLFSGMKHPHLSSVERRDSLAITITSMATTTLAFLLTMIGTGDAMAGLKTVANRVSDVIVRHTGSRFQGAVGQLDLDDNAGQEREVFPALPLLDNSVQNCTEGHKSAT